MNRIPQLLIAGLLVLTAASSLHAQNASCPAGGRMMMRSFGGPWTNLLDGAAYDITLGRMDDRAGTPVLAALVKRNGVCLEPQWVFDSTGANQALTLDTNVCLGGAADYVRVITTTQTVTSCGVARTVQPFAYAGHRLAIYGGGGDDELRSGAGKDWLFGGSGNDHLIGGSGSEDELYGETGHDTLDGSSGGLTYCAGGPDNDGIADNQGSGDWLEGGSGNDAVSSSCNNALLTCGSGTDWAMSPNPAPIGTLCERWDDLSC